MVRRWRHHMAVINGVGGLAARGVVIEVRLLLRDAHCVVITAGYGRRASRSVMVRVAEEEPQSGGALRREGLGLPAHLASERGPTGGVEVECCHGPAFDDQ